MRTPEIKHACWRLLTAAGLCALGLAGVAAQTRGEGPAASSIVVAPPQREGTPVAAALPSEMECSGFIELRPPANRLELIGAEEEQEQRSYGEGDHLYISGGSQQGVRVGQEFSVIRPRGSFRTRFSRKKGSLGMYTQEMGRVRVVRVKQNTSVALVTAACDSLLLGDLLREAGPRPAPRARAEGSLDRFTDPTGKAQGRIVLARDGREVLTRDQVVFIDLGVEDNVKAGDYLTVYRRVGTGNISRFRDSEVTPGGSRSFESPVYRGGKFSNKAQRVKDPVDGNYRRTTTSPAVRSRRPELPRKVVGEIVVISVEARTAAAIITRAAQEIHTGDFVEVQ